MRTDFAFSSRDLILLKGLSSSGNLWNRWKDFDRARLCVLIWDNEFGSLLCQTISPEIVANRIELPGDLLAGNCHVAKQYRPGSNTRPQVNVITDFCQRAIHVPQISCNRQFFYRILNFAVFHPKSTRAL